MFLVFVASSIVLESLERLVRPQQIIADQLLTVAILGLIVNIAGIFLLVGSEKEDENTAPEESSKEYEAVPKIEEMTEVTVITENSTKPVKKPKTSKNENLAGLFLHITSDALGSVGVIVSAVCIKYYGIAMADAICSLGISALIILSIISLLKSTVATLTVKLSEKASKKADKVLTNILCLEGIVDCEELKVWVYRRNELMITSKIKSEIGYDKAKLMEKIKGAIEGRSVRRKIVELSEGTLKETE